MDNFEELTNKLIAQLTDVVNSGYSAEDVQREVCDNMAKWIGKVGEAKLEKVRKCLQS